ncbi:hypothetical protein PG985_013747 [Apiospora marii]|uniref:HMG box domain-containing protein n=1 Tax=Apiospora marii TaxID=335849 RepID=A0ABR1R6X9_9PEZI
MAPSSANPPSLPPTVEEAYRRKCIQLRARTNEIEEENDAYRLRAIRLRRQIQKLRLERAILLEQIQKRTSTNVEDSEGSPSPPPTPEDKPLRVKRGHRKTSLVPGGDRETGSAGPSFVSQTMRGLSPGSEFSHGDSFSGRPTNGHHAVPKPPKRPSNAFEIYCNDMRPVLQEKHKDEIAAGEFRLEEELARGWKDLPDTEKEEFQTRYEQELTKWREGRDAFRRAKKSGGRARGSDFGLGRSTNIKLSRPAPPAASDADEQEQDQDQDVEMGDAEAAEAEEAEQEEQNDTDPETEVDDGQDQGDD